MTLTLKNVRPRPECCFRWWKRAKTELKGRSPPEDGWERFWWIVFISTSLMPDLTSGLKALGRVRQKCAESEHRCAHASVSGARTCAPHVIVWCGAADHRSPGSINHTYHLCVCVCDSGANTCYRSAPSRAAWRRVDAFTRQYADVNTDLRTDRPRPKNKAGGVIDLSTEVRRALQSRRRGESSNKRQVKDPVQSKRLWWTQSSRHTGAIQSDAYETSCLSRRTIGWRSLHRQLLSSTDIIVFLPINPHVHFFFLLSLPFSPPHLLPISADIC